MVNKDEFPKNKIFIFLKYWPTPFGIYKHVVKSKMQKNNFFFVFKKSMIKHIFLKSRIFIFSEKKECSKYVRVLAVCNTQKYFLYFFLSKTQASQLIAIKDNKPCAYILKVCKKTKQSKKKKKSGMALRSQTKKLSLFLIFLDWI